MNRQIRILAAAAALLVAGAAEASAQFTGVVSPPPKRAPAAVARTDSAGRAVGARDSANVTRLTNMKAWVDSATVALTGSARDTTTVTARATVTTDSVAVEAHTGAAAGRRRGSAGGAEAMHDGARAPDTASTLPTIGLFGVLAVWAGLALMGRRRSA